MEYDLRQQAQPLKPEHIRQLIATLDEQWHADRFLIKRNAQRWMFRTLADLYYQAPDGSEICTYASCRDINDKGVGLICKEYLEPGTRAELVIDIDGTKHYAMLRVVHSTQTVGGYKVGCEFITDDRSTIAAEDPEQLKLSGDCPEGAD